jgi:hypothetical protein
LAAQKTLFISIYYRNYVQNRNILKVSYSIEREAYKPKWENVEEKGTVSVESMNYEQVPLEGS